MNSKEIEDLRKHINSLEAQNKDLIVRIMDFEYLQPKEIEKVLVIMGKYWNNRNYADYLHKSEFDELVKDIEEIQSQEKCQDWKCEGIVSGKYINTDYCDYHYEQIN